MYLAALLVLVHLIEQSDSRLWWRLAVAAKDDLRRLGDKPWTDELGGVGGGDKVLASVFSSLHGSVHVWLWGGTATIDHCHHLATIGGC